MVTKETVLVLGAGASAPYGFPSGQRLKDLVCYDLPSKLDTTEINAPKFNPFKSALQLSGRSSVDSFLESRREYLSVGKQAIAATLLPREKKSNLFQKWQKLRLRDGFREDFQGNMPWYDLLFGILTDGVSFENVKKSTLSVITFNYDRSFEQFLFTALKNSYGKSDAECADVLNHHISVVHVYGSLGKLEWQEGAHETNTVPYQSREVAYYIRMAADSIQILHEGSEETAEFQKARELLNAAEQVFFLGFGYYPVNLQRLGIGKESLLPSETKGTALGLDKARKQHFDQLSRIPRPGFSRRRDSHLKNVDVYTLLHDHVTFS